MAGYSDYSAQGILNWVTGQVAMPVLPQVWLALFTVAPTSDSGSGGTEVSTSGTGYARVQVAGNATTNAVTSSGNVLHFASTPTWIVAGMTIYDVTNPSSISAATTVASTTGTTVVMSGNVAAGVGSGDIIVFSAWAAASASAGTEPSVTPATLTNSAAIAFSPATGSGFGTVVAFGLYDAGASGNLLAWDYLGNFPWQPATVSSASPGIVTCHAHGFSLSDPIVITAKYGGTIPTFSQSNFTGVLAVAATVATDTFTVTNSATAVNTSSTGDFMVRKILQQSVPGGITASFAASTMPFYVA